MASLTGQLQTENRGKSVLPGEAVAPSFMSGLLGVAGNVINAVGPMSRDAEQRRTKQALNDAEQAQFDYLSKREEQLNPAYKAAGDELEKSRTAENQGRLPSGSTDIRAEKIVSQLYADNPGDKAAIAQYLQGRGFDHYLFQAVKQEEKWQAQEQDNERAMAETAYKKAVEAGAVDPTDYNKSVATGLKLLEEEYAFALEKKKAEESRANATFTREEAKFIQDNAEKGMVDSAVNIANLKVGSFVPQLTSLFASAAGDKDREKMINDLQPKITFAVETFRANALSQMAQAGASSAAVESFNKQIDNMKDNVSTLFNANYEANKRALDIIKTNFALDEASALPVYGEMVRLFGQNSVNALFNENAIATLAPEAMEAIKQEFKGYRTAKAAEGRVILNNIAQLAAGTKGLRDMSEKEARDAMPGLVNTSIGNQNAIVRGDLSLGVTQRYINGYSQLLNAAVEIQPGSPDLKSINNAIRAVAGPGAGVALGALQKDPNSADRIDSLVFASRGTTGHLLRAAQQAGPDVSQDGVWSIKWDPKNGTYKVQADRAKLAKQAAKAGAGVTAVEGQIITTPGGNRTELTTIPPQLQLKADSMNMAINHLVATAGYDKELPSGWTPLSLRNHYAKGTPIKTGTGEKAVTPDEAWDKAFKSFETEVQNYAVTGGAGESIQTVPKSFKGASISSGDAVSRLASRGVPTHVAQGIVGNLIAESGLNTGAVGDAGKAMSLAQWHPDRRAHAEQAGFDLSDPGDALDFVLWELNNTEHGAKEKLAEARTAIEAADIFALYFLRPAGAQTGNAENVDNIKGRRQYTREISGG